VTSRTSFTKSVRAALALLATGAVLMTVTPAHADPTTVADAKAALAKVEEQASSIEQQYNVVQEKLDKSRAALAKANKAVAKQTTKVAGLRQRAAGLAVQRYQTSGASVAAGLITSQDTEQFLRTYALTHQVDATVGDVVSSYVTEQKSLEGLQADAAQKVDDIKADEERLAGLQEKADAKVAAAKELVNRLSAEQRASIQSEQRDAAAQADSRSGERATGNAATALAFAKSQVGKAYRMGATGPGAYDCSGLMLASYRAAGVGLPRTSQAQFSAGRSVSRSELKPGDLVFFYSGISHVGMYVGNGVIVDAGNPRTGVRYTKLSSMPYAGARRIVG